MDSPVASVSRAWSTEAAAVATRPICIFFAMGGCNKGDRCPFSHELVQVAPKGVDVSNGFYISGNVANYKSTSTVASPSSPNSGCKSEEAGNSSSADGLSTLASPSTNSVAAISLSTEAKEWVVADSNNTGVAAVSWGPSATTSTTSVKSLNPTALPTTRVTTASPPYTAPAPSPAQTGPSQQTRQPQRLGPTPPQPPNQPPTPSQNSPLAQMPFLSQSLSTQPAMQASLTPPPPQQQPCAVPLPPKPRSVANARHNFVARNTESPVAAPKSGASPTPMLAGPPAAVVGKYSVSHPVIQGKAAQSIMSLSSLSRATPSPFSSSSSTTPPSTGGPPRREFTGAPAIAPMTSPRYTASSTVIASPTTPSPTLATPATTGATADRFSSAALLELQMSVSTLATRAEAPMQRRCETNASAVEAQALLPTMTPTLSTGTAIAPAALPQYETRTAPLAAATALSTQSRVMPPAPRSQQQQQAQLRAQLHLQPQQDPSLQMTQQPKQPHRHPQLYHITSKQAPAQPQQQPTPLQIQSVQFHHHQQQPQAQFPQQQRSCKYPQKTQQQQQQQTVYLMAQPRSAANATPSREDSAATATQPPCGYAVGYTLPTNTASPTQVVVAEQPSAARPTYTVVAPGSPQTQQHSFPQAKNAMLFLAQGLVTAHNSNTASDIDNAVPRFILVKADGTLTVLQTAF